MFTVPVENLLMSKWVSSSFRSPSPRLVHAQVRPGIDRSIPFLLLRPAPYSPVAEKVMSCETETETRHFFKNITFVAHH